MFLKRAFDIVVSAGALVLLSPVLAVVAIVVLFDSGRPVFFPQERIGRGFRPFRLWKFRTMRQGAAGLPITLPGDERITRAGRILRACKIDELPQLWNVLKGDMSLVGPRPHALSHDHDFERRISLYARRHNVKPGITGWAQVNGYRGETDTDDKIRKRVEHDLHYIDNWSLWLDLQIIARTALTPTAYKNAY